MKAVVQRIKNGIISVDNKTVGSIQHGLLVYLGVEKNDTEKNADSLAKKIAQLRIFEDLQGKMNISVKDISGEVLTVSQFTLCADTTKGNRPSFNNAEIPEKADEMVKYFNNVLSSCYNLHVETGIFRTHMDVAYTNDGPVTIILVS
ncbi:MAG: D-tyrosyl-tRNA(Tyr) deacylase [Spirochaetia bacterium]|nr:D-tyrosyl-tRNA(Tyr) deacylase [Spirochaetia bacterium]